MHILIVDDEPTIREMLIEVLEDEGHSVAAAPHGQAALDYLTGEGQRPALILLDLMMPVMTGWQFREAQLAIPALADIPVIILSAAVRPGDDGQPLAAAAVIPKPIDFPALFRAIQRCA